MLETEKNLMTQRLLTSRQAAARLAISERKLWNLSKEGRIPAVKFDRVVRYDVADLDVFIQAMKGAI
jgi:excisionase family DNA binding protein